MQSFPLSQFSTVHYAQVPNNNSGIFIDPDKASKWPTWAEEADMKSRLRFRHGDNETTRYFRIPYDRIDEFKDYILGYPLLIAAPVPVIDPAAAKQAEETLNAVNAIVNPPLPPGKKTTLQIVVAQVTKVSRGEYSANLSDNLTLLLNSLLGLGKLVPSPSLQDAYNALANVVPTYQVNDRGFLAARADYLILYPSAKPLQNNLSKLRNFAVTTDEGLALVRKTPTGDAIVEFIDLLMEGATTMSPLVDMLSLEPAAAVRRAQAAYDATHPQPVGILNRVTPAQDPQRPWLYAVAISLVEAAGKTVRCRYLAAAQLANLKLLPVNTGEPNLDAQNQAINDAMLNAVGVFPEGVSDIHEANLFVGEAPNRAGYATGFATVEVVYRDLDYDVLSDNVGTRQSSALAPLTGVGGTVPREMLRWAIPKVTYALQMIPMAKIQAAAGADGEQQQLTFIEGPYRDKVIPEPGAMLLPTSTIQITLRDWPCVPWDAINRLRGKVNSFPLGPFPRLGMTVLPVGAALCQPASVKISRRTARGDILYNITLRFDIRNKNDTQNSIGQSQASWNSFPGPNGTFFRACFGGRAFQIQDSAYLYKSADLRALFVPPAPMTNFP